MNYNSIKILGLVLILSTILCCCSSDSVNKESNLVSGIWKLRNYTVDSSTSLKNEDQTITHTFTLRLSNSDATVNFDKNGRYDQMGTYTALKSENGETPESITLPYNYAGTYSFDEMSINLLIERFGTNWEASFDLLNSDEMKYTHTTIDETPNNIKISIHKYEFLRVAPR